MAHYVANRADYTARAIAYMAANADRYREAARQRRANAPDEFRAKERAYYAANRQAFAVVHQRRRAHKLNNPGSGGVSRRDWMRQVHLQGGRCYYCGTRPPLLHMEHVIPLSRGGRHALGNVVGACPPCNLSKHDRFHIEWRTHREVKPS